jgi:hypothetical protein
MAGDPSPITSKAWCQRAAHPRQSKPEARVKNGWQLTSVSHNQNQRIKGQPNPYIRSLKPRSERAAHFSTFTTWNQGVKGAGSGTGGQCQDQEQSPGNGRSPATGHRQGNWWLARGMMATAGHPEMGGPWTVIRQKRWPATGGHPPRAVTRQGGSPATGAGTRHRRLLATRGHPPRAVTRHGWPVRRFFDFLSF